MELRRLFSNPWLIVGNLFDWASLGMMIWLIVIFANKKLRQETSTKKKRNIAIASAVLFAVGLGFMIKGFLSEFNNNPYQFMVEQQ